MKNNNEAAAFHMADYDMVVNEECWIYGNCQNYVSTRFQEPRTPQEAALLVFYSSYFRVYVPLRGCT